MATAMLLPQRRKQNTERISNIKKKSLMFFRVVITLYSVAAIAAKEIFLIKHINEIFVLKVDTAEAAVNRMGRSMCRRS